MKALIALMIFLVMMVTVAYANTNPPTVDLRVRCNDGQLVVVIIARHSDGTVVRVRVPADKGEVIKGTAVFETVEGPVSLATSIRLVDDFQVVQGC